MPENLITIMERVKENEQVRKEEEANDSSVCHGQYIVYVQHSIAMLNAVVLKN